MKKKGRKIKLWPRIVSILIIALTLLAMYLSWTLGILKEQYFSFPMSWLLNVILFWIPIFYYGWFEKKENKIMRTYTKIVSILWVLFFISNFGIDYLIEAVIVFPILLYYGWIRKNK